MLYLYVLVVFMVLNKLKLKLNNLSFIFNNRKYIFLMILDVIKIYLLFIEMFLYIYVLEM